MPNQQSAPKPELLFVYGSLLRGIKAPAHAILAAGADFTGRASLAGRLYEINGYPGAVPADNSSERVHGEVYALHDPATILRKLDDYEGCGPNDPQPHEFIRRRIKIRHSNGTTLIAWVYWYNQPLEGLIRIHSGDYPTFQPD